MELFACKSHAYISVNTCNSRRMVNTFMDYVNICTVLELPQFHGCAECNGALVAVVELAMIVALQSAGSMVGRSTSVALPNWIMLPFTLRSIAAASSGLRLPYSVDLQNTTQIFYRQKAAKDKTHEEANDENED